MAGSVRNVSVRFTAEIQGFRQAMAEAAAATRRTADAADESSAAADTYLGRLVESANESRDAWDTAGASLLGIGTAAVAGLALAGKAAMDWETAWAGVTKTVDGTPAQMDELEASLRGLAKTLPATHEEIAGVAEAAGQLGVKREDVVGFTETMIALGETTNLTADEAATAIAQISNVMGTMERDGSEGVERFSATLVALGNAGASTEAEILGMAQRLAGAGKLIGASESDVLALANAMASVGIEAQLGGGVMSRVMQRMYGDVMTGGEGLEELAKVAGVSSKEFATAFETDPVRAVDMMVKGLSRVKDEGGNVMETMSGLGIKGTEETSVILRLAGAGELLADSLKLGDSAWESNSALAAEAAKRYETTESKVKVAWNNIKDAAISAGAVLLPMIAGIAEGAAGLASAFGAIPAPIQGVLTVLGGVAGVAALGAGAFLTLTPRILDSITAFNTLAPAGGRARGALMGVAKAAGAAMALGALTIVVAKLAEADYMSKIDAGMGRVTNALAEISTSGPGAATALDQIFKDRDGGDLIGNVTDLESAIKRTFKPDAGRQFNDWGESLVNGMTGVKGSSHILAESFERLDAGLAELVSGGKAGDAAKSFEQIKKAAEDQGVSVEDLAKKFPQYADALKAAEAASKTAAAEGKNLDGSLTDAGEAAKVAAEQSEEIEKALEEVGIAANGTVTDLVKFTDALFNAGLLQLSARDAARGFEEAIDNMAESLKENGRTLDTNTEKGRANEAALDAIAGAGYRSASAMAANGSSQEALAGNLDTTFNKLAAAARGFTNTDGEAQALARDIMKIPPGVDIKTWMSDEAKRMAEATTGAIDNIPKSKTVNIYVNTHESITKYLTEKGAADLNAAQNGGATGGRVADIMGFAGGGKVPGRAPSDLRLDNVLGLVNGKPIAVQSEEWIINGRSSKEYDRELAAINAGTFPKMPGYAGGGRAGREYSAQSLGYGPVRSVATTSTGGMHVENLTISEQSDPVATFHEFSRRAARLGA
jgi:TP901 family phage tail tape measure protein